MSETLLVRAARLPDDWECSRLAADARTDAWRGSLADIALRCRRARVILVVPGSDLSLHRVIVPARGVREIQLAVPFLLEEQLPERLDALRFATAPQEGDGHVPVAVTAASTLRALLDPLAAAGIQPAAAIPEMLALPWREGTHSMLLNGDRALVRTGGLMGFAVERALLPRMAARLGNSATPLRLWCETDGDLTALEAMGHPVDERLQTPEVVIGLLGEGLHALPCRLNLLQDSQATRRSILAASWKPAVVALLLSLLLHVAWSFRDIHRLEQEGREFQQRNEAVFRGAFPEVKRIVNLDTQAEAGLRALRVNSAAADFLNLYAHAGAVLQGLPQLRVEGMQFSDARLILAIAAPDRAELESAALQIAKTPGLTAHVADEHTGGDSVAARLVITRAIP